MNGARLAGYARVIPMCDMPEAGEYPLQFPPPAPRTGDPAVLHAPVADHLRYLELRGHTDASVYARWRALTRLAGWLAARHADTIRIDVIEDPLSRSILLLGATADDLAAWRASLTTGPAATMAYVSHVRNFYDWAVAGGLRDSNPAAGLPVPRLPRRLPRPVSEDDLMAALACAPGRVRPWLVLAGWAGFRAREIALLRRENVLEAQAPPQLLVAADAGKGRRERLVPMSSFVLAELRAAGLPSRGWVFPRHDGRPGPNAPWLISQLASRCLREAGSAATLHQLRHRYATQFYQRSDIRTTQEVLGHSSPATTAGYADWDRAAAAEVAEELPVPGRLRVVKRKSI